MAFKSCCCNVSVITWMRVVGAFTIALSVANVILLMLTFGEALHQQAGDPKRFFVGHYEFDHDGLKPKTKIRVSTLHAIRSVELLLNLFNITICTLQIIHSVKRDCLWITSSFLVLACILFTIFVAATHVIFYFGVLSMKMYGYHLLIQISYLSFICIVFQAYRKAKKNEDYGESPDTNYPMDGSQTSNNGEITMETRFT